MFFMRKCVNVAAMRLRSFELSSILGCEASSMVNKDEPLLLLLLPPLPFDVGEIGNAGRKLIY
jgi:hypothetical protein